jgi:predicted transcriptional regulator
LDVKLRIFKAVANANRIKLLKLLHAKGKMPLGDIVVAMDLPGPTVCRNLKILENVGFVQCRINHAIAEYWLNGSKQLSINQRVVDIIIN